MVNIEPASTMPGKRSNGLGHPPVEAGWMQSPWGNSTRYAPGSSVFRQGSRWTTAIIQSGWACEMRILADGRRQIFSFLLPGDIIQLAQGSDLGVRGLVALTRLEARDATNLLQLDETARDARARMIREAVVRKEDRLYDHMLRLGRLTAKERVAHLLLELHDRLAAVGLVKEHSFRIPLTQEVVADSLGLSIVHINRTLQQLRREGWITLRCGAVTIHNAERLAMLACYDLGRSKASPAPALEG